MITKSVAFTYKGRVESFSSKSPIQLSDELLVYLDIREERNRIVGR